MAHIILRYYTIYSLYAHRIENSWGKNEILFARGYIMVLYIGNLAICLRIQKNCWLWYYTFIIYIVLK